VDARGATVPFAGGVLRVPADAVVGPTTVRVRQQGAFPASPLTPLIRQLAPVVAVDLSGAQPKWPLRLELSVDPKDVPPDPAAVFVASRPGGSGDDELLPADYDPTHRLISIPLTHLSLFAPVLLNVEAFGRAFGELIGRSLLALRSDQPQCARSPAAKVQPATGEVAQLGDVPWPSVADPEIYACLSSDNGSDVLLDLTDNRPESWAFAVPATGTTTSRTIPDSAAAVQKLVLGVRSGAAGQHREVLPSGATVRLRIPGATLPARIELRPDATLVVAAATVAGFRLLFAAGALGLVAFGPLGIAAAAVVEALVLGTAAADCLASALNTGLADQPPALTDALPIGIRVGSTASTLSSLSTRRRPWCGNWWTS